MEFSIILANEHDYPLEPVFFERITATACQLLDLKFADMELSLTLVDDEEIRALNLQYRDKDAATDVLSFPQEEEVRGKTWLRLTLGDIVISYPRMQQQAQQYGHSERRELAFLFLHGFLHLLGFDHESPDGEAEMLAMQESILHFMAIDR